MIADRASASEAPVREQKLLKEEEGLRPYHQNPGMSAAGGFLG
jgi:hypothetical protein